MEPLITTVGVSIVASSISSITNASKNIYELVSGVYSVSLVTDHNLYIYKLKQLDIENTIKTIELLLLELDLDKYKSNTVEHTIISLKNIITELETDLATLFSHISYNNSLYVGKYWRSYDCTELMKNIELKNDILQKRFKLFIETSKISFKEKKTEEQLL